MLLVDFQPKKGAKESKLCSTPPPPVDPSNLILNSYPLDLQLVQKHQQLDAPLPKDVKKDKQFSHANVYGNELIIYQPLRSNRKCIGVPQQLQYPAVEWTHSLLGHAGIKRLIDTLNRHFWFPQMKTIIEDVIRKCGR